MSDQRDTPKLRSDEERLEALERVQREAPSPEEFDAKAVVKEALATARLQYEYRCGAHGVYEPDFTRDYDGEICPRIMCLECEQESMDEDIDNRPKDIPYFVNDNLAVILGEAHRLSAVWKFHPPVIHPEFTFAEDLSPVLPEGALTSEEIMARMEEMLPQIEEMAQSGTINVPDPRDLLILPGKDFSGGSD